MRLLRFKKIQLEKIKPYYTRPVDSSFANNLTAKIATHNYVAPIAVVPRGPLFLCAGGVHRFLALKNLKRKTAPCMVYEATDRELPILALLDNEVLPLTRIDKAKMFRKMLDEGLTEKELCDELKISNRQLKSILVLLEVPEKYKDKITEYPKIPTSKKPLSSSHIEEVEKLSKKNRTKRRIELYSLIMERARQSQADETVKIYTHRNIRKIVTMSNAQPERPVQEIADEIEKGYTSTEDEETVKITCPKCKGRGYVLKKKTTVSNLRSWVKTKEGERNE